MENLTLKELRQQFPNIKSTSKKGFLTKLKEAQGLGDTIEAVTEATGAKKAIEWLTSGKDCGCDKRKKILNEKFRYKANCLVESEYNYLTEYFTRHDPTNYKKEDVKRIHEIFTRVFRTRLSICTNCGTSAARTLSHAVEALKNVHSTYSK